MNFFSPILRHKKIAATALCLLAVVAIFIACFHKRQPPLNTNISTPALAVETLDAQSVYFTLPAREYLSAKKPQWVAAHDSEDDRRDFLQAEQNPSLWRQLDHKYHFDAALLCGDPGEYSKLMEHLIASKDWTLTYVDHTSFIFRRPPAKPWSMNACRAIMDKFANYPGPDRSAFLTQFAGKMLAIGQIDLAKQQLDESLPLDSKSPETWTQLAVYESRRAKWNEALADVAQALAIDGDYSHALSTKAQVLYSAKQFGAALDVSAKLLEANPDNPNVLFFHAKIAHDARAYRQEIPTLKHLVEIVEKQKQPTAGFRIYLAQAYARDGQAEASLQEFEKALAEGGLSADQREFIDESVRTIKSRTSL